MNIHSPSLALQVDDGRRATEPRDNWPLKTTNWRNYAKKPRTKMKTLVLTSIYVFITTIYVNEVSSSVEPPVFPPVTRHLDNLVLHFSSKSAPKLFIKEPSGYIMCIEL